MWEELRKQDNQQPGLNKQTLPEAKFFQQLLLFLNTYLMMQEGNKAVVFAVDGKGRSASTLPSALRAVLTIQPKWCGFITIMAAGLKIVWRSMLIVFKKSKLSHTLASQ